MSILKCIECMQIDSIKWIAGVTCQCRQTDKLMQDEKKSTLKQASILVLYHSNLHGNKYKKTHWKWCYSEKRKPIPHVPINKWHNTYSQRPRTTLNDCHFCTILSIFGDDGMKKEKRIFCQLSINKYIYILYSAVLIRVCLIFNYHIQNQYLIS